MYCCVLGRFGGVFAEVAAVIHTSGSANLDGRKNLCFSFGVPDMSSLFFQKKIKIRSVSDSRALCQWADYFKRSYLELIEQGI